MKKETVLNWVYLINIFVLALSQCTATTAEIFETSADPLLCFRMPGREIHSHRYRFHFPVTQFKNTAVSFQRPALSSHSFPDYFNICFPVEQTFCNHLQLPLPFLLEAGKLRYWFSSQLLATIQEGALQKGLHLISERLTGNRTPTTDNL